VSPMYICSGWSEKRRVPCPAVFGALYTFWRTDVSWMPCWLRKRDFSSSQSQAPKHIRRGIDHDETTLTDQRVWTARLQRM